MVHLHSCVCVFFSFVSHFFWSERSTGATGECVRSLRTPTAPPASAASGTLDGGGGRVGRGASEHWQGGQLTAKEIFTVGEDSRTAVVFLSPRIDVAGRRPLARMNINSRLQREPPRRRTPSGSTGKHTSLSPRRGGPVTPSPPHTPDPRPYYLNLYKRAPRSGWSRWVCFHINRLVNLC